MTPEGIDERSMAKDEGWFTDPWGRHEARWISEGRPTDLVRDGDAESHDTPPNEPQSVTPTFIDSPEFGAEDVQRADEAEAKFIDAEDLRRREVDGAEEGIDSST